MDEEERSDLVTLIARTRQIIEWVVFDRGTNVPPYLRAPLRNAWTEVTRDRFRRLEEQLASGGYDAELQAHGLSGLELKAKLAAFNARYEQWAELERTTRSRRFRRPVTYELNVRDDGGHR
jgi:hypothetical protein